MGSARCTVVDANHFSLRRRHVGNGVGGATGTVDVLAFAGFQQPSDGDAATASSINVPSSANGDRTAALLVATGKYKLADLDQVQLFGGGLNTVQTTISTAGSSAFAAAAIETFPMFTSVQAGDVLEVEMSSVPGPRRRRDFRVPYSSVMSPRALAPALSRSTGLARPWGQGVPPACRRRLA